MIGHALRSVAETMGAALVRSAFSPNIKERRDCSAALFDAGGRLVAQAEHIPLHLGSLLGGVAAVLQRYGPDIGPGDVFVANDPYGGGGTHLPDVAVITPLFHRGRPVAFAANLAHHVDIGGSEPGGIAGSTTSIYAEGLRLPPLRLQRGGRWCRDVLDTFLLNCRDPEARRLDLESQVAANALGARRLQALLREHGADAVRAAMGDLLDYAERRLRAAIRAVPDGTYTCGDHLDDDGAGGRDIPIRVAVGVEGDALCLDFRGSGAQVAGAVNVVRPALLASVYYAVRAALDPGVPPNGGFHRAIRVQAPPGSILNPRPPAAVGARTDTCQIVAGVVLGALAQALPDRLPAASNDASIALVVSGSGADRETRPFVYVEAVGGGGGARPDTDGLDGVQVHVTNTSNLPVEALESAYPLRVERYELIADSGGTGRFRGGLGIRRDLRVLAGGTRLSTHGDRQRHRPRGLAGGGTGRGSAYVINPGTAGERRLPSKVAGVSLRRGDLIRVETPGGGGHGDPRGRDPGALDADVRAGRVSPVAARRAYGHEDRRGDRA